MDNILPIKTIIRYYFIFFKEKWIIYYYYDFMSFKENLRFIMDCRGIQIKELAAKSGISENTIKSYLKENSADPTLSKAIKIAHTLDVNLEKLCSEPKIPQKVFPEQVEIENQIKDLSKNELRIVLNLIKSIKENKE